MNTILIKKRFFRIMRRCIRCSGRPRKIVRGPRGENFPPPAQIYASAQTVFLSRQPQEVDLSCPTTHSPDEAKKIAFFSQKVTFSRARFGQNQHLWRHFSDKMSLENQGVFRLLREVIYRRILMSYISRKWDHLRGHVTLFPQFYY